MARMEAVLGVKLDQANSAITDVVRKQAGEIEALSVANARLEGELAEARKSREGGGKLLDARVQAALMRKQHLPHDVQRRMRQEAWALTQEGQSPEAIVRIIEDGVAADPRVSRLLTEV